MHTLTAHGFPDTYRDAANRLATASLICAAILTLFLVGSEEMLHWFVVPVFCCGVLVCLDAVDWVTGRRDVFDPVGIIGALGVHVFFVAPLLHVHWQYWMRYVAQPPDWRPWLGLMACLNFGGLLAYRALVSYMERRADLRPPARTRAVDFRRFPFAWAAGTALAVAAQVVVFLRFGGIGGYVDAFESRSGAFEGMGLQFVVAESVPILAFIGYAVWVRRAGRLPSWAELAAVLLCLVAMRLVFGGLRGSRSTTVWAVFWAVGIIHLWVRPLRRTIIVAGLVFLLAFMYVYGFYKAAGREGVRAVLTGSGEAERMADRSNRGIETAVLADLGRADVQAFLLYRLTRAGTDYQYAFGRTYFASATLFVPKSVWPDRPVGKRKEGTEALYGARSYVPGRLAASQVYGLSGEGMLNFGPWAAPAMFVPFGVLVGWAGVLRRKLPEGSVYLLMYPLLVNLCFVVLVSDSDNVIVFLVKNALVPLVVVLTGSALVATATTARAAPRRGGSGSQRGRTRGPGGPRAVGQAGGPGGGAMNRATTDAPGVFVVSLDFELAWGVDGGRVREHYRANLEGVRPAIAGILDLFREFEIHATWAVVGLLFFRDRASLRAGLPPVRPNYVRAGWSPYPYIESQLGEGEADDPLHYAPSVIEQIRSVPFQEIGTHTFSHYYCLEPVQSAEAFAADLDAANRAAAAAGIELRSLVFPINQTNPQYLSLCAAAGIITYRGNEPSWAYDARDRASESALHRLARMADSYVRMTGLNTYDVPNRGGAGAEQNPGASLPVNVPSSRFVRPYRPRLKFLEPLRLRRIRKGIRAAAREGRLYHLWWHPHNFGVHRRENLAFLRNVLEEFRRCREEHGMVSRSMGELAPRPAPAPAAVAPCAPGRERRMTVILGGAGAYPRMIYHALVAAGVDVGNVIVEDPVPRGQLLKRRGKKLGWGTVAGQVAFSALVAAPLSRRSRRRAAEIRTQFGLNDAPVPPERLTRVPSVNAPETLATLRALRPAAVVVSGTRIISREVLEAVPARFVNLHAGITPAYRGVHGGYWALADGRPDACGVTIHLVDAGIDTGAVLAQAPIRPGARDNFATYPLLQLATGLPLLVDVVRRLEAGDAPQPVAPPPGASRLYSHPTLWQYLYYRITRRVR